MSTPSSQLSNVPSPSISGGSGSGSGSTAPSPSSGSSSSGGSGSGSTAPSGSSHSSIKLTTTITGIAPDDFNTNILLISAFKTTVATLLDGVNEQDVYNVKAYSSDRRRRRLLLPTSTVDYNVRTKSKADAEKAKIKIADNAAFTTELKAQILKKNVQGINVDDVTAVSGGGGGSESTAPSSTGGDSQSNSDSGDVESTSAGQNSILSVIVSVVGVIVGCVVAVGCVVVLFKKYNNTRHGGHTLLSEQGWRMETELSPMFMNS